MPKKITIKVEVCNEKGRIKAMKIASGRPGVNSVAMEGNERDQLVVTGEGVDSVKLTNMLRKKLGHATIVSVKDVKKKNKYKLEGEDDEDCKSPLKYFGCYSPYPPTPYYQRVVYDPEPHSSCSIM
ncbi:hypothetical protein QN277_016863 [Acacia crassicarpa]|uniref:Uncharacterized protein n=1 Tax=Acacia crassicarpa TaxID=499986 RepID=A0AAE1TBF0_9FABA|nr:hypothetical protein QN277_016863 [Acacia crassicarpa]